MAYVYFQALKKRANGLQTDYNYTGVKKASSPKQIKGGRKLSNFTPEHRYAVLGRLLTDGFIVFPEGYCR